MIIGESCLQFFHVRPETSFGFSGFKHNGNTNRRLRRSLVRCRKSLAVLQAVPATGALHRKRKKWRPQSEHRYGERIHCTALSKRFWKPTPLKSTDKCGQCAGNTGYNSPFIRRKTPFDY